MKRTSKFGIALALAFSLCWPVYADDFNAPQTVIVVAGSFMYRASGEYTYDGHIINAPLLKVIFKSPLEIMAHQVRRSDYSRCLAEGACPYPHGSQADNKDFPQTGVSYGDATAYAKWLSKKTDENWRLPTDEEWAFSAGSRFIDDSIDIIEDNENPSIRWLAEYQQKVALKSASDPTIKPVGTYGANENGIFDMSGNVWEWTSSCYTRTSVNSEGKQLKRTQNCGVHTVAGLHRAYLSFFVQDAKGGGCSVGAPPTYLGFRLVKAQNFSLLRKLWTSITPQRPVFQ